MNVTCQAFFFALGTYLSTFQASPPHSFINNNSITLHNKIIIMTDAVTKRSKINVA